MKKRRIIAGPCIIALMAGVSALVVPSIGGAQAATSGITGTAVGCADLTALRIPDVRITEGNEIRPDPIWKAPPPEKKGHEQGYVSVPFCRVQGVIEDEIRFELWLPAAKDWNGRFLGVGNGGFAGFLRYDGLSSGVSRGFATVSTDTGHRVTEKQWPIDHPRRLENMGHRGQHLVAVNAKRITQAFYGKGPHHAYFLGCSGGGMQAMNEVQRYPADYDGIIAGAHGRSIVGISARWLASALYAQGTESARVSKADWKRIAGAAVAQCDAKDGVRDGVIADPKSCRFDIASVPGLNADQVATAKSLFGPIKAKDGHVLFEGFDVGTVYSPLEQPGSAGEAFAQWYYGDADWDFSKFDAARDIPLVEAHATGTAFANPNLQPFFRRGGKLISFHGLTDEIVPADSTVAYWQSVQRYLGDEAAESYNLYLLPGMDHCDGGPGADSFGQQQHGRAVPGNIEGADILSAMVRWVEEGKNPGRLTAAKVEDGRVTFTRPMCPFPTRMRYLGNGDQTKAESFECAAP